MSQKSRVSQKHMTLSDRIFIEQSLAQKMTFKEIAKFLQKDPTTISKEVKKHRIGQPRKYFGTKNDCKFVKDCTKTNICSGVSCNIRCARNKNCNCKYHCSNYTPTSCEKLDHSPFVCNGCDKVQCRLPKYYYRAKTSYDEYKETLSSSRSGINLSKDELNDLDTLVSPLLLNRQPVAHIYSKHGDNIPCSGRTLYRYIDSGVLSVKNIDLPRKVKYKPRKSSKSKITKDKAYRRGRTYQDFLSLLSEYPDMNVVEMDTVIGSESGKVLLTMLFRNCTFMLAFLMENNTQESVISVFRMLQKVLGSEMFNKMFPVFLTDNGSEFLNPGALECDEYGEILSKIYYCDANAAYQKARLEKNHEFIRYIIPKGTSFDSFCQEDITLMLNHVNSTARASLNGHNPFELASLLLDRKLFEVLGLEKIEHDRVLLKPALLKH